MAFYCFKKCALGAVILMAAMGLSLPASANMISVTVTTTANIPVDTWEDTVVVTAGIEMAAGDGSNHANTNDGQVYPHLFSPGDSIDIGAISNTNSSITNNWAALDEAGFLYAYSSTYSGIVWDDDPATILQTVLLNEAVSTGIFAWNISNIVADGFTLQATVDLAAGAVLVLDLTHFAPVPLPAAAWLFISALGGLVVAKRRQQKA